MLVSAPPFLLLSQRPFMSLLPHLRGPREGVASMPLCDCCLPWLHWVLRMMSSIARRARLRLTSREGHQPMGPSEVPVFLSLRLAKSSQSSSIYPGSHTLPVKETEAMIRNGGSCTQNKERSQSSGHIPQKGIRLNVGLLHTVGFFSPSLVPIVWTQGLVFLRICMLKCNPYT